MLVLFLWTEVVAAAQVVLEGSQVACVVCGAIDGKSLGLDGLALGAAGALAAAGGAAGTGETGGVGVDRDDFTKMPRRGPRGTQPPGEAALIDWIAKTPRKTQWERDRETWWNNRQNEVVEWVRDILVDLGVPHDPRQPTAVGRPGQVNMDDED